MTNWFGPASWGAPICATCPRCDIPVGIQCARCDRPITETDCGVTLGGAVPVTYHLACHLKSVLAHSEWPAHGLTPDVFDGLENGVFLCRTCGMAYSVADGWLR